MSRRIDEIGFGGLRLIQDPQQFCYGVDAVILADMAAKCKKNFNRAFDLGTGNGIIPHILAYRNPEGMISGIDIMSSNIEMAKESARMNGLEKRLSFLTMDVNDISAKLERNSAELVTCNPPYFPKGGGIINDRSAKYVARQETTAEFDDFARQASYLLKDGGHFCVVHRPSRIVDIMYSCRKHKLEPKEMQFVIPREGKVANIVLIHCVKGGGKQLKLLPQLAVHGDGNSYTDEILKIYERF